MQISNKFLRLSSGETGGGVDGCNKACFIMMLVVRSIGILVISEVTSCDTTFLAGS